MLTRYRVGIIPNLKDMHVYIYDVQEDELKESKGNIFDMFQFINQNIEEDDTTILIREVDMISVKFLVWKNFSEIFNKRHKYKQWEKRRGKFIPEVVTDADMQSEFFQNLVSYGVNKEMQIVTSLIAEAYKRKCIDVYSYGYANILEKIKQPISNKPSSYHKADLVILNKAT